MFKDIIYIGEDKKDNWFFNKYAEKNHLRYHTFQLALNLLSQRHYYPTTPTIIETGCQRELDDYGAGMSTSIFAEYIFRYGGKLISVDNNKEHLSRASRFTQEYPDHSRSFIESDSIAFLQQYNGPCDLLYLDSYDYPYDIMLDKYEGKIDIDKAISILTSKTHQEIINEFPSIIPCQKHCLNEFKSIEDRLQNNTIILIDDNDFPGGGKPGLLKNYLLEKNWICLLDSYQTLWIKEL